MAPRLTLVTLDCRPFDITKSVGEADATVYSPTVLHLRGQTSSAFGYIEPFVAAVVRFMGTEK